MNVRLEKTFSFLASTYLDGTVLSNKYVLQVEFLTNTLDHWEQNTALDRLRHMLYNKFSNRLFIDEDNRRVADQFSSLNFKTVLMPGPPVDQLIGIMLFVKLNAVMEDRLIITQLKLASELGDDLFYLQDSEEDYGPFEDTGWWNESSDSIELHSNNIGNVVSFSKPLNDWSSLGLDWQQTGDFVSE